MQILLKEIVIDPQEKNIDFKKHTKAYIQINWWTLARGLEGLKSQTRT